MNVNFRMALTGLALVASIGVVACNETPTTPTTTVTTTDLFFVSQLMPLGVTSRSFKVAKAGEVKVLFTSLLPESSGVVSVALGTFDGTACTPTNAVAVAAGSTTPIITTTLAAGDYCVRIADTGVLTRTNDFSITVTIPSGS